jgi:hypothetical protein
VTSAHEEGFGRVQRAAEVVCDLGYREAVEVPQRERGPVVSAELGEHLAGL